MTQSQGFWPLSLFSASRLTFSGPKLYSRVN
ncbi:uncharacterized protein CCOS01_04498 [Colletotrichum costaricense]|uniref:Uncharacterized protein n=1 Tax=Colletotrichum costaricense TaxID=1209916 RepID=A0AAI9Z2I1_9PEZI|nr:uncharacterized protein CCOS01_04498 [Colletotrichum costaricense]KAK1532515.1 hypothetical protein CCOS01_04498 [Colletotrichum costaricense]